MVARAVLADIADGGFRVPARHWASRVQGGEELSGAKAIELFLANEIGRERISDEVGSDLFTRIGTKALATATTALRGRHSGLIGPLKTGATAARGVALATYLLARGAVARNKTGAPLVAFVLAVAGAVVAIPVITGTDPWGALTTLAAIVLAAGFMLALIRSGWVVIALLALAATAGVVLALVGVVGNENDTRWQRLFSWFPDIGPAIPVAVVVALAILFGLVRKPDWAHRSHRSRWNRLDMPGIWPTGGTQRSIVSATPKGEAQTRRSRVFHPARWWFNLPTATAVAVAMLSLLFLTAVAFVVGWIIGTAGG